MTTQSSETNLVHSALLTFHKQMPPVFKDDQNPHFKNTFASLSAHLKAADPVLVECGLSVVQLPGISDNGQPTLITRLCHVSGQYLEAETPLMLPKDDPQGQGSAITYMRRYAYAALLGIAAEDDDAEAARKSGGRRKAAPKAETVNGDEIPAVPEMETTRTGPGGSPVASGKQIAWIRTLLKDAGHLNDADVERYVRKTTGDWKGSVANLTPQMASAIIDDLKP